jgi:hypothetical protein
MSLFPNVVAHILSLQRLAKKKISGSGYHESETGKSRLYIRFLAVGFVEDG